MLKFDEFVKRAIEKRLLFDDKEIKGDFFIYEINGGIKSSTDARVILELLWLVVSVYGSL
jgi:hypothetical protein